MICSEIRHWVLHKTFVNATQQKKRKRVDGIHFLMYLEILARFFLLGDPARTQEPQKTDRQTDRSTDTQTDNLHCHGNLTCMVNVI